MIFKEVRAGSFKAVLELKHSSKNLFDEPVQSQTLAELFELLFSSEGEETRSESISFCKDALPEVASFVLDKQCKALLLKVTTKSSSKEKVSWTLKSISENDQEDV